MENDVEIKPGRGWIVCICRPASAQHRRSSYVRACGVAWEVVGLYQGLNRLVMEYVLLCFVRKMRNKTTLGNMSLSSVTCRVSRRPCRVVMSLHSGFQRWFVCFCPPGGGDAESSWLDPSENRVKIWMRKVCIYMRLW